MAREQSEASKGGREESRGSGEPDDETAHRDGRRDEAAGGSFAPRRDAYPRLRAPS